MNLEMKVEKNRFVLNRPKEICGQKIYGYSDRVDIIVFRASPSKEDTK